MKKQGFQLIELMISLSVICILMAGSYPLYSHYLMRAKRLEAATQLSKLAIAMEQFQLTYHTYKNATLDVLHFPTFIVKGNYRLIIVSANDHDFMLHSKPLGNQAKKDRECGTLTLNSLAEKGISGEGKVDECW